MFYNCVSQVTSRKSVYAFMCILDPYPMTQLQKYPMTQLQKLGRGSF